jgi:hypothetical protein
MTPQDIQTIYDLLSTRVVPQSAREGMAIMQLGARLVSHFANPPKPPQDSTPMKAVSPTPTPPPPPDPTPDPPAGP